MQKAVLTRIAGLPIMAIAIVAMSSLAPIQAQTVEEDETDDIEVTIDSNPYEALIVTGTLIRQGGAQDIRHFRSIAFNSETLPRPESLTLEGLMGEHDLVIPSAAACEQLLCLAGEVVRWSIPARPDDRYLVGLGMSSNADAETLQNEPLNLVAVIDKSGSMNGEPLDIVRKSLSLAVEQMRDGDQLSIVLYGDRSHVYMEPTQIGGNRDVINNAIRAIQSAGSTNMEQGLGVGYATAFETAPAFDGKTRLMLFTDEQPNVGRTDAQSFSGMAKAASLQGVGLTTIGVGVQFDGALAHKISSTRGGNLFFFDSVDQAKIMFAKEFRNMVQVVAHDVVITMKPPAGYKITGVYGVPDELMESAPEGAVTVTINSAFLSNNAGGIFVGLGKDSSAEFLPANSLATGQILDVQLSYVDARNDEAFQDQLSVTKLSDDASPGLVLAGNLVDEYFSLRAASLAFHRDGKPEEAYSHLHGLSKRLAANNQNSLDGERELIDTMLIKAAYFAGYAGENSNHKALRPYRILGEWEVVSVTGMNDIYRGDTLSFNDNGEMITKFRKMRRNGDQDAYQSYAINEREIYVEEDNLLMRYSFSGNNLRLATHDRFGKITLRRVANNGANSAANSES